MSDCGGNPEKCKMCGKKGLPILLTRYAVATRIAEQFEREPNAPRITGDFVKPDINLDDTTHYTLRLLRGGYVYVYDEARKTWKGYFVTDEAHLMEFNVQETFGQSAVKGENPEKKTPCQPIKYSFLAGCITLEKPEEATNLWVAFSDVQWTEAVWKKFDENKDGVREKQMRKLDIKTWLETQKSPHACRFEDVSKHVAEYFDTIDPAVFDFSLTEFLELGYYNFEPGIKKNEGKIALLQEHYSAKKFRPYLEMIKEYSRARKFNPVDTRDGFVLNDLCVLANVDPYKDGIGSSQMEIMLANSYISPYKMGLTGIANARQISDEVRSKLAVLALDDAPGIAMDLAALMSQRVVAFNGQKKYERKLFCSGTITHIKNSVFNKAELNAMEKKQNAYRREHLSRKSTRPGIPGILIPLEQLTPEQEAAYNDITLTPEELEQARQDAWATYSKMYPEPYNPPKSDAGYPKTPTTPANFGNKEPQAAVEEKKRAYDKEYQQKQAIPLYDEEAREAFQKEYDKDFAAFDQANIFHLANAHAAWMSGPKMAGYFQSHYDTANADSGMVYVSVLSLCIGDSQDKEACGELYSKWIESGDTKDSENLLMRAAVLNQDELAETVKEAVEEAKKLAGMVQRDDKEQEKKLDKYETQKEDVALTQANKLFDKVRDKFIKALLGDMRKRDSASPKEYKSTFERLKKEDQLSRLLLIFYNQTIGAGVKHMMKWAETRTLTSFMFCRAGISNTRTIFVEIHTTMGDFMAYVLAESANSPDPVIRAQGEAKLAEKLQVLKAQGMRMNELNRAMFSMELDFSSMTPEQRKKLEALFTRKGHLYLPNMTAYLALRAGDWDEAIKLAQQERAERFHQFTSRWRRAIGKWAGRGLTGFGVYTAIAGVRTSLKNVQRDMNTTAQAREAWARFLAAITTMLSTWADVISRTYGLAYFQLKLGRALQRAKKKFWGGTSKWLGVPGIVVSIVVDIAGLSTALSKGQTGLAWARGISATLGIISLPLLFSPLAFISLIILVTVVIISVLISAWEDDPYRDWIGRCYFGKYPNSIRYSNTEDEIKAFQGI
jgi:hypothetical protein